jgi:hypothetical protein
MGMPENRISGFEFEILEFWKGRKVLWKIRKDRNNGLGYIGLPTSITFALAGYESAALM